MSKENKNLEAFINKIESMVGLQTCFEKEVSDYTTENFGFGTVCAGKDWYLDIIRRNFKNMTESQKCCLSFIIDCAENYEFFTNKIKNREWDALIKEQGEIKLKNFRKTNGSEKFLKETE